jgi:two-component system sensor histidine kinase/response regulator
VQAEQLARRGLAPVVAGDAVAALAAWDAAAATGAPFELAVVDFAMPGGDGAALAVELRARAAGGALRVVLLSAVAGKPERERVAGLGDVRVLSKPVREHVLVDALFGRAEPGAAAASAAAAAAVGPRSTTAAPGRVLVVEDNAINQRVAQRMLQSCGLQVLLATDGAKALDVLAASPVDVVLMDCQMPVMDGYTATTEIRRREAGAARRVPIVALTANAMGDEMQRCLAAGMDDYLAKPVRLDDLRRCVGKWLAAGATAPPPPPPTTTTTPPPPPQ